MSERQRGQVSRSAAEVYEEFFIPALFGQWTGPVQDAAGIGSGHRVLDVACGTGVLARAVMERVGAAGSVVGLDSNPGMLGVAMRCAPNITWQRGAAEALPFDDSSFDAVVSQFGLMFFDDRKAAIREMIRVLRPGGGLAVAVWDSLDNTPGYAAMSDLLERLFGSREAGALRAPFAMGDPELLRSLFDEAGVVDPEISAYEGVARFPSIRSWVHTDVKGWTLADMISDEQFELLLEEAQEALKDLVTSEGTVAFRAPALIVSATKKRADAR